jgi:hypothetical protein
MENFKNVTVEKDRYFPERMVIIKSEGLRLNERVHGVVPTGIYTIDYNKIIKGIDFSKHTCSGGIDQHEHDVYCGCESWGNTPDLAIANSIITELNVNKWWVNQH